ncbi:signal recognition particle protein [Buchnera aphidicola]|uniref:Signal recognition particle protein n=1 Tax=Buchnera aphidicola (Therioaphis trifolii) TaxID=1241884 RepID=A0A4D6YBE0_9GAMM|nr:signal recognition particle protein [Buchnera aphidicola]QCI27257.1 signal recognition particle protein [Buchnera aphidicola (Therioaphis trifolii)]
MFNNISNKFISIIKDISGYGRITEKKLKNCLKKIKITLLEADVALPVIKEIINKIKKSIIGKDINLHLTPGQEFIKILKEELIFIMSHKDHDLKISKKKLNIFLIIGIQGSGKTTTIGKLGHFISKKYKKNILVSSTDIYRPAAIEQLEYIAKKAQINFFKDNNINDPITISKNAIKYAKKKLYDILILDTAGRLHTNNVMMNQINKIQKIIQPNETLFVIDSMMGQDAINIAKQFTQFINISGLILTKVDSDTRGGAALSASYITKKPIKFIGTGEKIESISIFEPKRIVSKILGMGDILSIIEKINQKIDKKQKIELIKKNNKFNLNDFKLQIQKIKKFGGINNFISKIPLNYLNLQKYQNKTNDKKLNIMIAIIDSMTPLERMNPKIIKRSRKKRISKGSGTTIQNINILLKQFYELKKMMNKIKNKGIKNIFQNIKNIFPNIF